MGTRISIIMPNYNHAIYLKDRIPSILSQMAIDDEFIIVDDASTDNSVSIIEKFLPIDPRLKLIKNPNNLGAIASANIALFAATGKYLTWLGSDDSILPGFIDKTIQTLLTNPEIGICCSDCAMTFIGNPNKVPGEIYITRLLEKTATIQIFFPKDVVKVFCKTNFWIPSHTAILKRDLILKFGGYPESFGYLTDWFLMHAIALEAGVAYIPEALSVWLQEVKTYSATQQADPVISRQCQFNLFSVLKQKNYRHLYRLFKKSGILHVLIRPNLLKIAIRPYYWGFLFSFIKRFLWSRRINTLILNWITPINRS